MRKSLVQPRPEVAKLVPALHGGTQGEGVLDFSANINPFGPSPLVREALLTVPLDRYPDPEATKLRLAIAEKLGVGEVSILVGNGSVELIRLIALAYLRPGDRVVVVEPAFGEYRLAANLMRARVETFRTRAEESFHLDVEKLVRFIRQREPRLVFLCNPDNPTGRYLGLTDVEVLLEACQEGLLVLDEAFVNFTERPWSSLPLLESGRLLILRSMTKDYALTGLRLGYAVGPEEMIQALGRVHPPWSVNAFAQAAGIAALADEAHLQETLAKTRGAKAVLASAWASLGLSILPSAVHFFLSEVGDAEAFSRALLQEGIAVRDCTSFGLPHFVRIGARKPEENKRLLLAIEELLRCNMGWKRS